MDDKGNKRAASSLSPSEEENRKIRVFRFLTDLTCQRLYIEEMTLTEAREAAAQLRCVAERMFPGKQSVFDLVLAPRLERVIRERFGNGIKGLQNYS